MKNVIILKSKLYLLILVLLIIGLETFSQHEFNGPFSTWKNLKIDFGATGDGVTDDTKAFQTALDSLKNTYFGSWNTLYIPKGTYRIKNTLVTTRTAHTEYLGIRIIGEDPEATIIEWHGETGGIMFDYDAWFDKVSRLTFDGRGLASQGIYRVDAYTTFSILSELIFKNFTYTALNFGDYGIRGIEQYVQRCRFYNCGIGVLCSDWNSLNVAVTYSYFEGCGTGIFNGEGGFHAYANVFNGSTKEDLAAYAPLNTSIVNNTSINSKSFIGYVNPYNPSTFYLRGNKIYNPDSIAINMGWGPITMLDNLFVQKNDVSHPLVSVAAFNSLLVGNTYATDEPWPVQPPKLQHNYGVGAIEIINREITKAIDNDPDTWYYSGLWSTVFGLKWNFPNHRKERVVKYAITSGGGYFDGDFNRNYDPKNWILKGSNDWGNSWNVVDKREGVLWSSPFERKEFSIEDDGSYSMYELVVTENRAGNLPGKDFFGIGELELIDVLDNDFLDDTNGLLTASDEFWGRTITLDRKIDSAYLYEVPDAEDLIIPFSPKIERVTFEVVRNTGDDYSAIMEKIKLALQEPDGTNPIVYIPKGIYYIDSTIIVPALKDIKITGDGAEGGTFINWIGGNASGPAILLEGPSRVTIENLVIWAGLEAGTDAIVIENADQDSGRIFTNLVSLDGHEAVSHKANAAMFINAVEKSNIFITNTVFSSAYHGIHAIGGINQQTGNETSGQIYHTTGVINNLSKLYSVTNNGRIVAEAMWNENINDWRGEDFQFNASLIELDNTSGAISLAAMWWHPWSAPRPLMATNNFEGNLTFVGNSLEQHDSTSFHLNGNGSGATIFGAANNLPLYGRDPSRFLDQTNVIWKDKTLPGARASFVSNQAGHGGDGIFFSLDNVTNKEINTIPDSLTILQSLAQIRAASYEPVSDRPDGVTDVRIFRAHFVAGDNRNAFTVVAGDYTFEENPLAPVITPGYISLDPPYAQLGIDNGGRQFHGIIFPSNASNKNITWSSGNPDVASVDQNGFVTPLAIGRAVITVTTEYGNKEASSLVDVQQVVDISDQELLNMVTMYPNPSNTRMLNLFFEKPLKEASIRVLSVLGKEVYYRGFDDITNLTINLNPFEPGMYIIQINSSDVKITKKIIIQ